MSVEIVSDGRINRLKPKPNTPFRLIDFSSALHIENYSPVPVKIHISSQNIDITAPWFEMMLPHNRGVPANCCSVPFFSATRMGAMLQASIDTRSYMTAKMEMPQILGPPPSGTLDEAEILRTTEQHGRNSVSQPISIDWPSDLKGEVKMLQYHFLRLEDGPVTHHIPVVR